MAGDPISEVTPSQWWLSVGGTPSVPIATMMRSHRVGALDISLRTHLLDHLACFRNGLLTVLRDPLMSGAMDAEF
jgi:hypothetical protein